jgi:hypothetical protein
MRLIATAAWCSSSMVGDLLGVNELHGGRCQSLAQLEGLHRPDEVDVGRHGCCTFLLYRSSTLLNNDI